MSKTMSRTTSKWGKYGKKYNKEWEKESGLKDWIRPQMGDVSKAVCRFCTCEIRAHHADLLQHANTEKHKKHCVAFSTMDVTALKHETDQRDEPTAGSWVTPSHAVDHLDHLRGSTDGETKVH